jgi:hypothetical protein
VAVAHALRQGQTLGPNHDLALEEESESPWASSAAQAVFQLGEGLLAAAVLVLLVVP